MDVQLKKIHFVKEFLRLNNEQAIDKLESLLKSEKKRIYSQSPNPMSLDDFNKMIDNAENDSMEGRITDAHDLKKDIQSWS
jgi:hypothetical protein